MSKIVKILRKLYFAIIFRFTKVTFGIFQVLGFHVIPNHFYQPIPDTTKLNKNLFSQKSDLVGIELTENQFDTLLRDFSDNYRDEYSQFPTAPTKLLYQYYFDNIAFGPVDAEILYCIIRKYRPRKIIEIGSGYSTYVSAQAIRKNEEEIGVGCDLIAIEPYPNKVLQEGFPGLSMLIRKQVQKIPISEFMDLQENDILFIDSSHVLKIGSDVQYEFLEILPRLNKGVIVHIHDIFLPVEYPREWIYKDRRFYTEQYLLQAFLMFNHHFEIIWAGSYMHINFSGKLESAFSSYDKEGKDIPCSFWLRRIR